jgi:hypothetical protein
MRRTAEKTGSETLGYIHAMLGELRGMAEAEKLDMLAYLIDMAHTEAGDILRGNRPSRVGKQ